MATDRRQDVKSRVWRYRVDQDRRAEFEREYGSEGAWAALFATAEGFVETTLYRDTQSPTRYLSVDRFASEQAWQRFRSDNDAEYRALGERLQHLTLEQEELV
jgi:heme-degrading monooxygenase HmoA